MASRPDTPAFSDSAHLEPERPVLDSIFNFKTVSFQVLPSHLVVLVLRVGTGISSNLNWITLGRSRTPFFRF